MWGGGGWDAVPRVQPVWVGVLCVWVCSWCVAWSRFRGWVVWWGLPLRLVEPGGCVDVQCWGAGVGGGGCVRGDMVVVLALGMLEWWHQMDGGGCGGEGGELMVVVAIVIDSDLLV